MIANCGHCGIVERRSEQRLLNMLNFAVTNFLNLKPLNNLTATLLHLIFFWKKTIKIQTQNYLNLTLVHPFVRSKFTVVPTSFVSSLLINYSSSPLIQDLFETSKKNSGGLNNFLLNGTRFTLNIWICFIL